MLTHLSIGTGIIRDSYIFVFDNINVDKFYNQWHFIWAWYGNIYIDMRYVIVSV